MKNETAKMIFDGGQNAALLAAIADLMGKEIIIHRAGQDSAADVVVVGDNRCILSPRISDHDYQHQGQWALDYCVADGTGKVLWVWIGHKLLGPCYQRGTDGKWKNCYSHGNFGKNYTSGGTWSGSTAISQRNGLDNSTANSGAGYDSLAACVAGRAQEIEKAKKSNNEIEKIFLQYAAIPATAPELIEV